MRKTFCGIVLGTFLAVTAGLAPAQTSDAAPTPPVRGEWGHGPRGPMDPASEAAHMAKRLNLTSEQQTQVQSILTNSKAQMKALNENQTITHQAWLAQTRALHEQTKSQIEGLLTDTQKAQMAEHRGREGRGFGGGPPPPPEPEQ